MERVTKIYMDFYYNGKEASNGEEDAGDSPGIVLVDGKSKAEASWMLKGKSMVSGSGNDWVMKAMADEIEMWGYGNRKVILVSDGEPAILKVKEGIIRIRQAETVPE